jgi:hypothetical protein
MDKQSQEWHRELKELESKGYNSSIQNRCCRAILNGAITLCETEDPLLMNRYTPKLKFCPECGKELNV